LLHFAILFACFAFCGINPSHCSDSWLRGPTANNRASVVIALDFTQSVAGKGYDGKTDFEKNVEAACQLIAQLPPALRSLYLQLQTEAFHKPLILLRRELQRDKGSLQFLDRIVIAKTQAATELRRAALSSQHSILQTDIFGALTLAADILNQSPGRKVLILFSDMRQSTGEVDFERAKTISLVQSTRDGDQARDARTHFKVSKSTLSVWMVPASHLHTGTVSADFWEAYFQKAGANLKRYSALRDSA